MNLGLNAAAAGGPGGTVTFTLDTQPGFSRCRVVDSGAGFTREAMDQFGTPFFSTRSQGTGLGLATSLKIIEDQGGSLEPGVADGGGGLVVMMLPLGYEDNSCNQEEAKCS